MIFGILRHTPTWVFAVFVALLALGFLQMRARSVPLAMIITLPCAMAIWSVSSLLQRVGLDALIAWGLLEVVCVGVALRLDPRDDVQYSSADRSFAVPGSWIPLALMMVIFFTRYVIGVLVAMHPNLPGTMAFDLLVGSVSGLSAGAFAGRAIRIGRVAFARNPIGRGVVSAS